MRWQILAVNVLFSASLIGCGSSTPANKPVATKPVESAKDNDEQIKQAFGNLQAAIKAKDGDKVWGLMAKDARDDAEREAKVMKESFGKLTGDDKAGYEKKVGLSAAELAAITGKAYVKSKTFYSGEVDELPDSKMDKIVMTGDTGILHYIEEKGDKEKLPVVREEGQWRFAVPVPKAVSK